MNYCNDAIDLTTHHLKKETNDQTNGTLNGKNENYWPDDHPEARRITNQVGSLLFFRVK